MISPLCVSPAMCPAFPSLGSGHLIPLQFLQCGGHLLHFPSNLAPTPLPFALLADSYPSQKSRWMSRLDPLTWQSRGPSSVSLLCPVPTPHPVAGIRLYHNCLFAVVASLPNTEPGA